MLHGNKDNDDSESEDDLPLSALANRNTTSDVPLSSRLGQPQARKWVKRDLSRMDNEGIVPPPRSVVTISDASDPVHFFELFFSHEVIIHIVRHTVIYAVEKGNMAFTLSDDEIYCFIGILILTGYCPLP